MPTVLFGDIKLLQLYLSFQVNVLKSTQYFYHEKKNKLESTNGFSNLVIQVTKVEKNRLNIVFRVQGIVSYKHTMCIPR